MAYSKSAVEPGYDTEAMCLFFFSDLLLSINIGPNTSVQILWFASTLRVGYRVSQINVSCPAHTAQQMLCVQCFIQSLLKEVMSYPICKWASAQKGSVTCPVPHSYVALPELMRTHSWWQKYAPSSLCEYSQVRSSSKYQEMNHSNPSKTGVEATVTLIWLCFPLTVVCHFVKPIHSDPKQTE